MDDPANISLANFSLPSRPNRLLLIITEDREKQGVTELMVRLALNGPFSFIAGGEWVPGRATLQQAVYRHTENVHSVLDRMLLARPTTYLQLLDLLVETDRQSHLLVVLDFLHLFYVPDVDLSERLRVLEKCCARLQCIKLLRPVAVFVQELPTADDFGIFFPLMSAIADETLEIRPKSVSPARQLDLF